jgi:hypothetical protein
MNLSEEVKRVLITADTFSLHSGHKQLTASTVLTLILEQYSSELKEKIVDFFNFKHKILVQAVKQTDQDDSGERYSNDLVLCLYKSKSNVTLDNLTKNLVHIRNGSLK